MLTWLRKSVPNAALGRTFDSIGTLKVHLEFRGRLEDYVDGKLDGPITFATTCHAGCLLGKWLHGEGGSKCRDIDLINSLCKSCEDFREAAANAVLLKDMGDMEMAKAALQDGEALSDASERFQLTLAKLHQQYSTAADFRFPG